MKILVLSTWFPFLPDNGSRIRAYYLTGALAQSHDVTLVAFHPGNDGRAESAQESPWPGVHVYTVPVDPFRWARLPQVAKFVSPIPVAFWPSRLMNRTVSRLADRPWDAVVAIQSNCAGYTSLLPQRSCVVDVDTALSFQLFETYQSQQGRPARFRHWVRWQKAMRYEKRVFARFPGCSLVSDRERAYVRSALDYTGKIAIVKNGVDCERNRPGIYPVQPYSLVYNGSMTYSANYDAMRYFLTEIYPRIQGQVAGVSLRITGSTKGVNLDGLPHDHSVDLAGHVPDIRPLVGSAAACVVPLRAGSGTRLKILEAMALGVPVVATSKGAEGLEVVSGEHILLADDPADFADRTCEVLNDNALRQHLTGNARLLVEQRYDWKLTTLAFLELVQFVTRSNIQPRGNELNQSGPIIGQR